MTRQLADDIGNPGCSVTSLFANDGVAGMNPSPLDLLEPGALMGGPLMRSLAVQIERAERLPLGTRLGPFRVIGELGKGGMGIVYRAERDDGAFSQQVAIKCVQRTDDVRRETLFLRESVKFWPNCATPISHDCLMADAMKVVSCGLPWSASKASGSMFTCLPPASSVFGRASNSCCRSWMR
jgi:hypothetical protein